MEKFEIRINNIALKYLQKRFEILKYSPNELYGKEHEFDKASENSYTPKGQDNYNYFLDKSCFENPESGLLLAYFNINFREQDCQLEWCGDRPLQLNMEEFGDFMDVVRYSYQRINHILKEMDTP